MSKNLSGTGFITGSGSITVYNIPLNDPSNLSVANINGQYATINFTPPSGIIDGYNVYNSGSYLAKYTGSNSITLSNLLSNSYNIKLQAYNSALASPISSSSVFFYANGYIFDSTNILQYFKYNQYDISSVSLLTYNYWGYFDRYIQNYTPSNYRWSNITIYIENSDQNCFRLDNINYKIGNSSLYLCESAMRFHNTAASIDNDEYFTNLPISGFTITMWIRPDPLLATNYRNYSFFKYSSTNNNDNYKCPLYSLNGSQEICYFEIGLILINSNFYVYGNIDGSYDNTSKNSTDTKIFNTINSIQKEQWYHIAMTASTNGIYKIYINGIYDTSYNTTYFGANGNTIILNDIGSRPYVENYIGNIDNLITFKRALTSDEIYTVYKYGVE